MIPNPFTPSHIATDPTDFFGRDVEIEQLRRTLVKSSAIIQGIMGIGKSSLSYQTRLRLEGFDGERTAESIWVVCDQDVESIDDLARLVLERLVTIDSSNKSFSWKLSIPYLEGAEVGSSASEVTTYFAEGRHMAALLRVLERDHFGKFASSGMSFVIAIDESNKQPALLTRFVRSLLTSTQGYGIQCVRFLLSGVTPFFNQMLAEDRGMLRFFPSPLTLLPLLPEETEDLLQSKFSWAVSNAELGGLTVGVHPGVVTRIAELSGGHPHIVQLLGSHVIDSENEEPDGLIDAKDLVAAFRRVAYVDRADIYNSILLKLEREGIFNDFAQLFAQMSKTFPTRIHRQTAHNLDFPTSIEWLLNENVIYAYDEYYYLTDELLKVRLILDADQRFFDQRELEEHYTLISDVDGLVDYRYSDDEEDDEYSFD